MNESIESASGLLKGFWSWLFRPRVVSTVLFITACLLTVLALFYTEENWRGKRAWAKCRGELEAKGAQLDWAVRIPGPVPDEQNLFKAPKMAEWFVKDHAGTFTNALSHISAAVGDCLGFRSNNGVADITILPINLNGGTPTEDFDAVLHFKAGRPAGLGTDEVGRLKQVVRKVLRPSASIESGPSLRGAQDYLFSPQPARPITAVQVLVLADTMPSSKELAALFPASLFAIASSSGDSLRIEPEGTNLFHLFSRRPKTCSAADYLACSDELAPALDLIRDALRRPQARREGDYTHPWTFPVPNFVIIRTVAQTLSQRAQCYLLTGQPDKALRELTLLHDLHRLLDAKPMTLVAAMIQVAVTGLYANTVADGLRLEAWQEPQLVELQGQLAGIPLLAQVVEAIELERVSVCFTLETTTPSELEQIFVLGSDNPSLWSKLKDPAYYVNHLMPRGWIYQNMRTIASGEQEFIEALTSSNEVVHPRQLEDLTAKTSTGLGRFSPGTFLARGVMPNYLRAFQTTAKNQTIANQALLACALQRYRLVHKQYPETLQDLVPHFVNKLPSDIINGGPLKYHRTGEGFLLYSVGWDELDGGGAPGKSASDGDWVWDSPKP